MKHRAIFEVIIIGGSYSGLAAAMALGRSLRKVLVMDASEPCNKQTPYSHNFLTHDGSTPSEIASIGRKQVENYPTVKFYNGKAVRGQRTSAGFEIVAESGELFEANRLVFASGIKDQLPKIEGLASCWGISVLHCPYCHGYEVKGEATGVLGNGDYGYEFINLIHNWTSELTLFTNGPSLLNPQQTQKIRENRIEIVEKEIVALEHDNGYLKHLIFSDGSASALRALYTKPSFEQHCPIPFELGCEFSDEGYILVDNFQQTTIPGVYACGDATSRMRTVANAVFTGSTAGMMLNKELSSWA